MADKLPKFDARTGQLYPADGYDYLWQPPPWVIKDADNRIVEGYASLPNLDDQGDVIPLDVIEESLPRFMTWGNLREMHDKKAAGKVLAATVDQHGLRIQARIDDPTAWAKVRSGVYQGFSLGGDIPEGGTEQRADGARIIKEVILNEISLVDRPANPKARITFIKLEKNFTGKVHMRNKCEKHDKEDCQECGCDRLVGHPPGTSGSSGMAEEWTEDPEASEKAADLSEDRKQEGKRKYGDVRYADPAHNKYPIDTPKHVRAALSYWGNADNRKGYSAEQQKQISARIHAAARRFGIGAAAVTKGIDMKTLEKVKATLRDPEEIQALEKAEQIIAKASGQEWHTQRDVEDPKEEADPGVDLMDNDAGEEDPVDEFIKGSGEADGETEKEAGSAEETSKADGANPLTHMRACHKALHACHKALEDDHPAKPHCARAIAHCQKAIKSFGKGGNIGKAAGAWGDEVSVTREEFDEMCGSVQYLANSLEHLTKVVSGLPRSRSLPPEAQNRDEEYRGTQHNARLAMTGNYR